MSHQSDMMQSRLVHLDMKGAPLCLPYLEKVLPLMKKWGCTGLLLEYEDTFPYADDLELLTARHGYSRENINEIAKLATSHDLEIVPLVQTFGHFEFVLKHQKFSSLREVMKYPMAMCPSNPDSLSVVCKMLDQVLELHPTVTKFHIGCDEVFHLGLCAACRARMEEESLSKTDLFFDHVRKVAEHLRCKYPALRIIIWDDMLRNIPLSAIKDCGLGDLVEPMVWNYQPVLQFPNDLWDNLSAVFSTIWVASAYKGATGASAMVTNIHFHLDNHRAWHDTLARISGKFTKVEGITLTGWQRYDHYAVLCELFPQSLPSLAVCLTFVTKGLSTSEDMNRIMKDLNFMSPIPFDPLKICSLPVCDFPGSSVYLITLELFHQQLACNDLFNSESVSAWMNDHNVERGFINTVHIEGLHDRAQRHEASLEKICQQLETSFLDVFVEHVLDEWRNCFVQPLLHRLNAFLEKTRRLLQLDSIT